jgi:putative ABC transport system permease protein
MLKHHLTVAIRSLIRHKGSALINLIGLTIGMAGCFLILLYVQDELSFDRRHENGHRIYRLVLERRAPERISLDVSTPPPLAPALLNDFPQIIHAVRFLNLDNPTPLVANGEKRFYEKRFFFADPSVFEVFTLPLVQGDSKTALQKPNAVVITAETAQRYFGKEDPMGKSLTINNYLDLEIAGVVQNPPPNSTIQFDFLASFSTLYGWLGKGFVDNWQNNSGHTYLLLSENFPPEELENQLPGFIKRYLSATSPLKQIHLQPLHRIHLHSYQDYRLASGGDIRSVYLLSAVAFFVLLIACINFINLTTARSLHRSREVGIRKVMGATKRQLVQQFLGEALLLTALVLLIAVVMVELALPHFHALIGRALSVDNNQSLWLGLLGIGLFAGLLSGSFPAFILSSFQPVHALKGRLKTDSTGAIFRKALVVGQFTLTITLMIGTMVVYNQLSFMQNKRLGFDKDQVIVAPIRDQNLRQNPEPLKSRLRQLPGILNVGAAALFPGGPVGRTRFRAEAMADEGAISMLWVDHDFIRTLGMEVVEGRDFSKDYETDATGAVILNEEAVRQLGWRPAEAIGKSFELVGSKKAKIIGVLRDFHFASLHRQIEPVVLHIWPWLNYVLIRVDATRLPGILSDLENIWQEFDPSHPFAFTFLDESIDRFYQSEKRLGQVSGYFSLLAIVIACLGLFALAAFTAEQRTKEIGIRKVLGATASGVVVLLSKDFARLVLVANLIAFPVAWYAMNRWLESFAYRIHIGWETFIFAGGLALIIALLTVSTQAVKAALTNPVEALRYE